MENIIIDKVARVPTARNRKIDTSAPMGMAVTCVKEMHATTVSIVQSASGV